MRNWIWKLAITAALIGLFVSQRVQIARQDERYRILREEQAKTLERQDAVEALIERFPSMVEVAFERHRVKMFAHMENKDD